MRPLLSFLLLAAAVIAAGQVGAQGFNPTRPIEFVVHTGPGGGNDLLARAIAAIVEKEKLLPVRMQVTNKPGGGGITAMSYMNEKKGETHTIALFANTWFNGPMMSKEARVTMNELSLIVRLVTEPGVVAVKSDSPYKTLKDFIDDAKKRPGELKQSGGSIGSRDNIVRNLLMRNTGAQWAFISFPGGGERLAALLGGHVQIMFMDPQEAGERLRDGSLRLIAQVAEKRIAAYPDLPTIQEFGYDIPNYVTIRGVVGPPEMPADALKYWENFFSRLVKTGAWKKYLKDNLFEDGFQTTAEVRKFAEEYPEKVRAMLKAAGIRVYR
ncbi:MAG: tripartite tricarboxylate transporter substrate binding protein [Betaproteobacteria bacterium]|nr:tripartite tricarboxylate transporter substrate binding protein [Betaproteobacteria bacterium]